ncbi:unnamed protein product [Urochloa humidicola]
MEAITDTAAPPALPDDVLEDILGRLPARSLAASQRVSKAWRDIVDDRQLLLRLRHLLPHSVRGLFVNYLDHRRPHFLARPAPSVDRGSGGTRINGKFSFIGRESYVWHAVLDHSNGLILDRGGNAMYVCNPMTQRCARLPPHHNYRYCYRQWQRRTLLAFDPAVSPAEWQVLMAPLEPHGEKAAEDMEPEERMMESCRQRPWSGRRRCSSGKARGCRNCGRVADA